MSNPFAGFLNSDAFMPHGHCYLWRPDVLWLNVISDGLIALSYFVIPFFLFSFYFRRKEWQFSWVLVLFSLFILGCGSTHVFEIWTVWYPDYAVSGLAKAFTAVVSVATAGVLWPIVPRVLAMPTAQQMAATNAKLQEEIAERIKAEEGFRQAKEAADLANSSKTAFLANVSHEIRTPLGAVMGFAELLKSDELTAEKKSEIHRAIKRNADLLLNVVNDILDLSKIEAGKIQISKKPVCLAEIVGDLAMSTKLQANEKGIAFHVDMAPDLPAMIHTDPMRLRQIILNVLSNAVKFTSHGEIDLKVRKIGRMNGDPLIAFTVKDSGIGIAPESARQLFEPFRQADDTTSRRYGGTGLGLVLARRLANALGGDLELTESLAGKGSVFTIVIESGLSALQCVPVESGRTGAGKPQARATRLDGMRVLLVDDSLDNLFLVSNIIESAGAEVVTASGGAESIACADAGGFDIILMDLQMPGIDGFMATREIRRRGYQGPVIALTAHGFSEVRERCVASGLDDHILKPVDPAMLLSSLAHFRQIYRLEPRCTHDALGAP